MSRRDLLRGRVRRDSPPAPVESPEVTAARAEILGVAGPAPRSLDDALGAAPLPEVVEARLTQAQLTAMCREFEQSVTMHQVLLRADRRDPSPAEAPSFELAIERLIAGDARAIQLRYTFEGGRWLDTISRDAFGFRLIRVQDLTDPAHANRTGAHTGPENNHA
ncbi:MAG: hypothetical protein H6811_10685 [Phycisphaeraceae bacterium]|nr:hypothetical protein [Phycisphaeraceae bacterium]